MGKIWPLQDAKAKLSQLVRAAAREPQTITRHGEEAVVVLSAEEYRRLTGVKPERSFYEIWKSAPKVPEFELPPRRREPMRKIKF
jgi:antitoxin Phd